MNRFTGKTVLITGGTSGMGLATAHRLLAEGAHVIVTGRSRTGGLRRPAARPQRLGGRGRRRRPRRGGRADGDRRGNSVLTLYSATKAAVHNLARTLAAGLAPCGIRVNSVSPGYIDTPMYPAAALTTAEAEAVTGQIVAGRFGRPEEVTAAVAFLASADASYINGQDLVIDGGLVGAVPA